MRHVHATTHALIVSFMKKKKKKKKKVLLLVQCLSFKSNVKHSIIKVKSVMKDRGLTAFASCHSN